MMAGSTTLGTYDTFNYFAAQAEKRPQPLIRRMGSNEIDILVGYSQYHLAVPGGSARVYDPPATARWY